MSNRLIAWVVLSGLALLVPLVLAAQLTSAAPATATFNVESTLDEPDFNPGDGFCVSTPSGTCTLRAAIMEANRVTTQDVTIMLPAGIYSITVPFSGSNSDDTGDFNLLPPNANSPLITIQGAGAATTILDGNGLDRLFTVHLNRQASLKDVTLRGGKVPGSVGGGLYIVSGGSLTLTDVTLSGNQSDIGGGIYNAGALVVMRSSVSSNSAKYGAGIDSVGPLTIMSSTLAYNTAITGGGALNVNAVVSINSSQFYGNSASTNDGGAIRIESPGSVTISGSQITANHAPAL
jgi:CSLREA domain-containing protein